MLEHDLHESHAIYNINMKIFKQYTDSVNTATQ